MTEFQVEKPILNSPFDEPREYWWIAEGEEPERRLGRRPALYHYRPAEGSRGAGGAGVAIELKLVNRIRERLKEWRAAGYPGTTRTTRELLAYWQREGRQHRLFFAQVEAAETIIFLIEARADLLQGIVVPADEPRSGSGAELSAFRRYACKMATGSGKTTVMGMLAAWSILNKVADRQDARFSDAVVVVCPNVTIRNRLQELNPARGAASIYATRDLVPPHLLPALGRGRLFVTNWHVFEPRAMQVSGVGAKVARVGAPVRSVETVIIGPKTTTARGKRYMALDDLCRQRAAGLVNVLAEELGVDGRPVRVKVETLRYVETDRALVNACSDATLVPKVICWSSTTRRTTHTA